MVKPYLGTLFSSSWWLEAIAPGAWDEIKIEENGVIVARWPYVKKKKFGFTGLIMPPLTQTLGPWLAPQTGKYVTQLSRENELMAALIEQLPPFDYFLQNFHYPITNWLPFYWQGFTQTTRYTYVIEDLSELDEIWSESRANIKTDVRKAQKQLAVRTDLGLESFLELHEKTFSRQGLPLPYPRELVIRLDQACAAHCCRQMFFAEDAQGQLHAAVYLVWDEQAAYYLMSGSDPDLRNSGATSLLLWEAIQFAATVTRTFDFEGSMLKPVERFFRAFGARQKPYLCVTKVNALPLKIAFDVRSWLRWHREL